MEIGKPIGYNGSYNVSMTHYLNYAAYVHMRGNIIYLS